MWFRYEMSVWGIVECFLNPYNMQFTIRPASRASFHYLRTASSGSDVTRPDIKTYCWYTDCSCGQLCALSPISPSACILLM